MAEYRKKKETNFDVKAIIHKNRIDQGLNDFHSEEIVRWGKDNMYPKRVKDYISFSPTGSGCNRRFSEFCYGEGFDGGLGDIVVNRKGETLNDILLFCINNGYSQLFTFALHFNFNLVGQITEIYAIDPSIIRKRKDNITCQLKDWDIFGADFLLNASNDSTLIIDMYNKVHPLTGMRRDGIKKYKGQVYFFSIENDDTGYPYSPFHSVLNHLNYEKESQIFQNASIVQGFSGRHIIKIPTVGKAETDTNFKAVQNQLQDFHGAENAGRSILIRTPLNTEGDAKPYQAVETLTPPNLDKQFVEQNKASRMAITSTCNMPDILVGIQEKGMFNQASFADAYNLKVTDTRRDRLILGRAFTNVLKASVWSGYGDISIKALKLGEDGT